MDILQIYRGDTLRLTVTLTDSGGEPFVPAEGQQVVFSVGWPGEVLVAVPVTEGAANLTHQDTARLRNTALMCGSTTPIKLWWPPPSSANLW